MNNIKTTIEAITADIKEARTAAISFDKKTITFDRKIRWTISNGDSLVRFAEDGTAEAFIARDLTEFASFYFFDANSILVRVVVNNREVGRAYARLSN